MPPGPLEEVIEAFQQMQSRWGPTTLPSQMRADLDAFSERFPDEIEATTKTVSAGDVAAEHIAATTAADDRAVLYFHGGGYSVGSPRSHRALGKRISAAAEAPVLLPAYRLAPEHRFPAPVEDARAAYAWLLETGVAPERVAVGGDSAGGGLALALMLSLRESGEPLPGCAILLSPWADMECVGKSYETHAALDPIVGREMSLGMAQAYLADADPRHPWASPIHASFEGLPPMLIQVGDREVVLDDARALAQNAERAKVPANLEVWPGMIHQWHLYASVVPDGQRAIDRIGRFIGSLA